MGFAYYCRTKRLRFQSAAGNAHFCLLLARQKVPTFQPLRKCTSSFVLSYEFRAAEKAYLDALALGLPLSCCTFVRRHSTSTSPEDTEGSSSTLPILTPPQSASTRFIKRFAHVQGATARAVRDERSPHRVHVSVENRKRCSLCTTTTPIPAEG